MAERNFFSALAMQFALGCGLCTATLLMTLGEETAVGFYPFALMVYAPLLYGANCLFLRREHTMAGAAILNGGAAILMFAAICLIDGWGGFAYMLFAAVFCIWPTVNGLQLAEKAPDVHGLILCVDVTAVLLVLFAAYAALAGRDQPWMLFPAFAGCAASFLALVTRRAGRTMGVRDWGLVLGAFGALMAVLWAVLRYAAAAGGGLVAAWKSLVAAVKFLLLLTWRTLEYLLSLLPVPAYEDYEIEMEAARIPEVEELAEMESTAALVMLALVLIALAVCLGWMLVKLRKVKLGGTAHRKAAARQKRKGPGLLGALGLLAAAWGRRLRLWLWLRRSRNTPEGIYCALERQSRRTPWHKRPGETAREFLLRLRNGAEDPAFTAALDELIPAVERALYAREAPRTTFPQGGLLRRRARSAALRHYLRTLAERWRARLARLTKEEGETPEVQ